MHPELLELPGAVECLIKMLPDELLKILRLSQAMMGSHGGFRASFTGRMMINQGMMMIDHGILGFPSKKTWMQDDAGGQL